MSLSFESRMTGRGARTMCLAAAIAADVLPVQVSEASQSFYQRHNLVSDGFIPADHTDTSLVNAWGIAFNPTGVWWVNAADSGISSLYDGTGAPNAMLPFANIPGADGTDAGGPSYGHRLQRRNGFRRDRWCELRAGAVHLRQRGWHDFGVEPGCPAAATFTSGSRGHQRFG